MRRRAASPRRQAHSGAWEKAATTRAAGAEQQVAGMLHLRDTGWASGASSVVDSLTLPELQRLELLQNQHPHIYLHYLQHLEHLQNQYTHHFYLLYLLTTELSSPFLHQAVFFLPTLGLKGRPIHTFCGLALLVLFLVVRIL